MKRILCVDDQEAGLEIRKLLLESQGHSVLTANTGSEALEAVRRELPDLVILDYRLADTSGEDIARELKRDHPDLPILLLSGYPQVPDSAKTVVNAFIVKGDPTDSFLRTIESLLDSPALASPSVVSTVQSRRKILERSEELMQRSQALADRLRHGKKRT
jgi:CheY-like chemotaxis protein